MAKLFSLASWNVEHFKNNGNRIERVVKFMQAQTPDVFALYEVEGKEVFGELVNRMRTYTFHITEGPQTQEILVGIKQGFTAFFTQKIEFKSGLKFLRPGALLTLRVNNSDYTILFMHTKSSTDPLGLGIRDDQFKRAFKFKCKLDSIAGGKGKSNFIFLGDLNTMGMDYPFKKDIHADFELKKLDREAGKVKMRRLAKDKSYSWWNGSGGLPPSNLDHVVASAHLKFHKFAGADIKVVGWPELSVKGKQQEWIRSYSDHALLYLELEK